MSTVHGVLGLGVGLLAAGAGLFVVRPTTPASIASPVDQTADDPAPMRVVRRAAPCPPALPADSPVVERTLQMLRTRESLLRGQLAVETGDALPPPTPEESPEAVAAFLEDHLNDGELTLDCSTHPCRGRLAWPGRIDNPNQRFRDAVYERFPDSVLIDSIALEDLQNGRMPGVTTTFVLAKGLTTDGQRRRVKHLYERL